MECKYSSYRQKRLLVPILSPKRIRLRTVALSVLCYHEKLRSRSDLSEARYLGIYLLRIQLLPIQQDPALHDEKCLKGSARLYIINCIIVNYLKFCVELLLIIQFLLEDKYIFIVDMFSTRLYKVPVLSTFHCI